MERKTRGEKIEIVLSAEKEERRWGV